MRAVSWNVFDAHRGAERLNDEKTAPGFFQHVFGQCGLAIEAGAGLEWGKGGEHLPDVVRSEWRPSFEVYHEREMPLSA